MIMIRFYMQASARPFFLLLISTACSLAALAQPILVKDINTTPASISPYRLCNCGPYFYFSASNEATGAELWRSDGTTQGTVMLKDVFPGSAPGVSDQQFACLNGSLLFAGQTSATGSELWKTDGTENGTQLLKEIFPGPVSGVFGNFIEHNGKLFFFGRDPSTGVPVLWQTDGSTGGTTSVTPLGTTSGSVLSLGHYSNGFHFIISKGGSYDLWRSDGTPGGTVIIKSSPWLYEALGIQDKIYFAESINGTQYLMVSDGTTGNYTQVQSFSYEYPQRFLAFEDKLLFDAQGIYVSDGTQAGTARLANGGIQAGTVYQGKYYGISGSPAKFLISTDGTAAGTQTIMYLGTEGYMSGTVPILNNRMVIFSTDDVNGLEPRLTDGTPEGTILLKDIAPGIANSDPSLFQKIGNKVFFLADNGANGRELWQTDGTAAGTSLLKDVNKGTESSALGNPVPLATLPGVDNVFFFASEQELGPKNLWQSDGTDAGTKPYYNFSGYANLIGTMADNDLIFFDDKKLIRSNGKPNGTSVFKDLSADIGSFYQLSFSNSTTLNGKFIFHFATSSQFLNLGGELWVTDGTSQGTSVLKDIQPGAATGVPGLNGSILGNSLIFGANDGATGQEPWTTDGTTAGTKLLIDLQPGPTGSGTFSFVTFNNAVYFGADDGVSGTGIWKTNGTPAGTQIVKAISPTGNPVPQSLAVAGDYLIFSAWDEVNGWATWRSDGTPEGTSLLKDINPSKDQKLNLGSYVFLNNRVYFSGDDGTHGNELWVSDGTANGTFSVDLNPGTSNSDPQYFTAINDLVYFSAAGKLWKTDGSPENITVASDIEPRGKFVFKNDWIYFIGASDDYGTELFKLSPETFTSIENSGEFAITLYPNPASTTLQIASTTTERVSVNLIDLRGTILSSFILDANTIGTHDVSQYKTGLYLVRINSKHGTTVKKFLKK
jgi:ELWxxDGT repeat protein